MDTIKHEDFCENFSLPTRRYRPFFRESYLEKIRNFIETNGLQKDEDLYKFIYKRAAQLKSVIDPINDAYISTQTRLENGESIDTLVPDLDALARHFLYFSSSSTAKRHSSLCAHIIHDKCSVSCQCEDPILSCLSNRWICFEITLWMECINWRFHEFFSDEEFVIREIEKDDATRYKRIRKISVIMDDWLPLRSWMLYSRCGLHEKISSFVESPLCVSPIINDKVYFSFKKLEEIYIRDAVVALLFLRESNVYHKIKKCSR